MWYRDETLALLRVREMEREIVTASVRAALREGRSRDHPERRHHIRSASAAAIRRAGQALIGLSDRIDPNPSDIRVAARHGRGSGQHVTSSLFLARTWRPSAPRVTSSTPCAPVEALQAPPSSTWDVPPVNSQSGLPED